MSADAFFRMGASHQVCQDYAVSGTLAGVPYAALADGCSSSPDTDWGARFLVRSAQLRLESEGRLSQSDGDAIVSSALAMARQACLPNHALDATLLVATLDREWARVLHSGDGVVAARRRDGGIVYYETSFDQGAPYYLSYLAHKRDRDLYFETVKSMTITRRERCADKWGDLQPEVTGMDEARLFRTFYFPKDVFDVVLLLSDGCQSFVRSGDVVALEDVLEQLLAIKGLHGEFITRRCNAFLQRFCAERGWKHEDDLSVAGLYLGGAQ